MRTLLLLNLTAEQQNYPENYSSCGTRDEESLNDRFEDQYFNLIFLPITDSTSQVIYTLTFLICIVGMVGNGCVIWLLGFCIKRNNFTIYVLNLAVADFTTLLCVSALTVLMVINILNVADVQTMQCFFWQFGVFTYCVGLYLLTAIGVERCLSILFPIWVRCYRPKSLSTFVSVLFWTVSAMATVTEFSLHYFCLLDTWLVVLRIIFGLNLFIFTPVMVTSTVILFMKMSFKHQPGKLHIVMFILLLFYIITSVPYGIYFFLSVIDYNFYIIAIRIYDMLVVLNSSINPIIYFFIGSQCNFRSWKSMKVILQRAFKEEADHADVY